MLFVTSFTIGFLSGVFGFYFYNHKNEISYTLVTLKEDLTSLHIKLDNFISSHR